MSEQIKICPVPGCGKSNPATEPWCIGCGSDLSYVSPVSSDSLQANNGGTSETKEWTCSECGEHSGAALLLCTKCGTPRGSADKTSGPRTAATKFSDQAKLVLVSGSRIAECKDGDILGRAGDVARELFENIHEVSGEHVLITNRGGVWYVKPLRGAKNETTLDGTVLERGSSYPLKGIHELGMSTKCTVRLELVSLEPDAAQAQGRPNG